jgi:hypothetical protein
MDLGVTAGREPALWPLRFVNDRQTTRDSIRRSDHGRLFLFLIMIIIMTAIIMHHYSYHVVVIIIMMIMMLLLEAT